MTSTPTSVEWRYVYGAVAFAAVAFFFFSARVVLSPFTAYLLVLLLVAPYAGTDGHRKLVIAATVVLALWLLKTLGALLAPFILALVLAYILDPATDALQRRGMRRGVAVAVLIIPVLAVIGIAIGFAIPAIINQFDNLLQGLPAATARVSRWLIDVRSGAQQLRLPFITDEMLASWTDEQRITEFLQTQQAALASRAWGTVRGVGRGLGIALSILGFLVLVPVLVIYLLRDFDTMTHRIAELVPVRQRAGWLGFMAEYDALLARFLRGQVIAATIVGILTWLGLWVLGVPYPALVGATAGLFNLVPYLGLIVSIIPILIIALVSGNFVEIIIKAGIVFGIVQMIDGTITGPRIVGSSVGLHPVWVLLALAVGSFFFGFVGLLIAMPAAVLIKLLLREGLTRYRSSAMFLADTPPA